jgi:bifunctional non-homologous end joining protein LigD
MAEISNPDKILFPDGFTKADLVGYYETMSGAMAPHVVERPLTLHRFPDGIQAKGFMQKNAPAYFPDSIERVEVPKRDGVTVYPVLKDGGPIPYLANLGTITFHVWTSRRPHLDRPDRLIFDLDPPEGGWEDAGRAARLVRDWLGEIGLDAGLMTTGSKGYHVVVSITPDHGYDVVAPFAQAGAALLAHRHPDLLTDEFRIAARRGRVFVDWLRNQQGQTGVAAWSVRARPGAPVATPIEWNELEGTPPDRFTIRDATERIGHDPIAVAARHPNAIDDSIAVVSAMLADAGIVLEAFDRFRS